ncbi:GGDEF domain-containing protein [Hahella aquimaris]|uniref:GGDEF domain-containing protein n=1 Tax=Hahella sp. HNIBRBA332 TaxID=3015983 RepID=UPI00273ACAD1|nr:GGDEF domain-containing protein [Hahella sp. HNIBRBA332]WLQ13154.1 GGDEF domain-containing protein [Hahella sp. HNIBRBA332]
MSSEVNDLEHTLFAFIESSDEAYALFNDQDLLVYCNAAFARLFNAEREFLAGFSFRRLAERCYDTRQGIHIESDDLEGWLRYAQELRRTRQFRSYEVEISGGRWFLFSEQIDNQGRMLVRARDLTAQKQLEGRINHANQKLRHMAMTDELTHVANYRGFFEAAEAEANRCWRTGAPMTLMLLDMDHFKKVNDNYGYPVGDEILRRIAEMSREALREYDVFGRIAGEEFAIFLSQANDKVGMQIAGRLIESIADMVFTGPADGDPEVRVTASIGLCIGECDTPFEQLFKQAEVALQQAKDQGRNRVEVFHMKKV